MAVERFKVGVQRAAFKRRQEDVLQLLAASGLRRGPLRLTRGANAPAGREGHARRLRVALEKLGPVFASFGLYMATRVDLLPTADSAELATLRDRAAASPPPVVRELLTREVGGPPEGVFGDFEETPFASRLLSQWHRAWLPDGQAVTVKLLRPEAEECLARDAELLTLTKVALVPLVNNPRALDSAMEDFGHVLKRKADLLREAEALEGLALESEGGSFRHVPPVHAELCTRRLLVVERPAGTALHDLLAPGNAGDADSGDSAPAGAPERSGLAHRLCVVWLRQIVLGNVFPFELSPEDVAVLPGGQLALTGGLFATLPPESRENLWAYLIAAANEDPGRACSHLLRELRKDDSPGHEDLLRQRFKQVVPIRDGGLGGYDCDSLTERLLAHWKLTAECGHLPGPTLTSFYRGLYLMAGLARRLAPGHDALQEAVQEVRLVEGVERFRAMLGPNQFGAQVSRYAEVVVDLPQRLDEVLSLASAGDPRVSLQVKETSEQRRRRNSSARVTALLLALASVALVTQRFGDSLAGAWVEKAGAVAFVLVGALLLRAASRG